MLVEMQKDRFEALDDEALFLACTEPAIDRMRGHSLALKAETISGLNPGQQALCMFRVLYPAQASEADFEAWTAYLLEQPAYWQGVHGGLRFWGETDLLRLLEDAREVLAAKRIEQAGEDRKAIQSAIRSLFERFQSQVRGALTRIGIYIRSRPQEFVQLTS
ncbi:hypothetical protein [Cohnella sp. REN36]|uniref:hypothetical protein n=1 Tax=Cohnella sp. REN36 TaxID=2887347 RepID=UPI001D149EA8|nr:hypothetical protein [Cohnella sp. REN36]MCC3375045.1 hypothetical protein [Cohnella sp. REN36]